MTEDTTTIALSGKDTVEWIRTKVRRGEFASETELVTEGVQTLRQHDEEFETWLGEVVTERYDALKANPGSALTLEQVQESLAASRRKRAEQLL